MVLVLMAVEIKTIPIRNFIIASIYNHDTKLIKVNIVRYVLKKRILVVLVLVRRSGRETR